MTTISREKVSEALDRIEKLASDQSYRDYGLAADLAALRASLPATGQGEPVAALRELVTAWGVTGVNEIVPDTLNDDAMWERARRALISAEALATTEREGLERDALADVKAWLACTPGTVSHADLRYSPGIIAWLGDDRPPEEGKGEG